MDCWETCIEVNMFLAVSALSPLRCRLPTAMCVFVLLMVLASFMSKERKVDKYLVVCLYFPAHTQIYNIESGTQQDQEPRTVCASVRECGSIGGCIVLRCLPQETRKALPQYYDEHPGDRRDACRAVHTEVVTKGKGF